VTFRTRLTLLAAGAVAIAVAIAALAIYVLVRSQLLSGIDSTLSAQFERISNSPYLVTPTFQPNQFLVHVPRPEFGGAGGYVQLASASGQRFRSDEEPVALPVSGDTASVAAGNVPPYYSSVTVDGVHLRVLTAQARPGLAIQVAQPLTQMDHEIQTIRFWLILIAVGGIGLAAVLGLMVARATLAPVRACAFFCVSVGG